MIRRGTDGDGNPADRRRHASGLYRPGAERKKNQDHVPLVRACTEYVETNVLSKIRVKDIADEIGYTENYISSVFKVEMGMSLLEYVNIRKIEMAKQIMNNNTIPIADLSDRLAFSNPSYFSAVFKKVTGMTPSEYQQK